MLTYMAHRLLSLIPVVFGITLIMFVLSVVAPGDPVKAMTGNPRIDPEAAARLRLELGLDAPYAVQYLRYLRRLAHGDLGRSYQQRRAVSRVIAERLTATARLAVAAMLVALLVGILAGILAAVRQASWIDHLIMAGSLLGISTPVFWLGMMLILLFGSELGWFPISGYGGGRLTHLVLPAMTLGALQMGYIARMTRSTMLEVIRQDFVRTARAKGLAEPWVVGKHALKNTLVPVVTVVGLSLANLFVGAPLTETVFAWPGIGRALVSAVMMRRRTV